MQRQGKLLVFEGPDQSGKTTLCLALTEYLITTGVDCQYFAFPGREVGTLGGLVHTLHHDSKAAGVVSLDPTALQVLHVAAHIDAIQSKILPALSDGKTVILDRFWWSTWVYGRVSSVRANALKAMIRVERIAWGKVRPITVFLVKRTLATPGDIHEALSHEYMNLAAREARRNPVAYIQNEETTAEALERVVSYFDTINNQTATSNGPISTQSELPLGNGSHVHRGPFVFSRITPAKPTEVFETYWKFAAKRQDIFFRRLAGDRPPWTDDPVLLEYKFTNAYRASDRVSQYLIRKVIYEGDQSFQEMFFRILLFKFFNKIETWELLERKLGTITLAEYSYRKYDRILTHAMSKGEPIYSAAYIMPSGGSSPTPAKKHQMHLKLLEQMIKDALHLRIADAASMGKAFELLRSYPTIGDFLAYQYVTDLNYSPLINFSEMEFVIPGPGARDGIRKCFDHLGGLNEAEIIKLVSDSQQAEFDRLGLDFKSLWGRPLQLIDCQNLFCEVDKYARVRHPDIVGITGRTRIKQRYRVHQKPMSVWYPPKWGLNERIASEVMDVPSV